MTTSGVPRAALVIALVFGGVWAAAVLVWRASGASPGVRELGLYMIGLPLAVLGGGYFWQWAAARRRSRRDTRLRTGCTGVVAPAECPPSRDRTVHLLASALLLPAGASAAEVRDALREPRRAALHPQLRDRAGLPLFAASVEVLAPDRIVEALRAAAPGDDDRESWFDAERLRAVTLLDPVAGDLLRAALPRPLSAGDGRDHAGQADAHAASSVAAAPALQVRVLLPVAWPAHAHATVVRWLQAKAELIGHRAVQIRIECIALASATEAWPLLDQLAESLAVGGAERWLLLAADSLIGARATAQLELHHRLLTGGNAEGVIPGEGAAGVLLAPACVPRDDMAPPPLRLHRLHRGDAGTGRGAGRVVVELVERALAAAALPAGAIATVLSDADHRPSRVLELGATIAAALPGLDPVRASRRLGLACGELGAVAPLALLAVAAAQAGHDAAPVLALSLADDRERVALVLSPPSAASVHATDPHVAAAGAGAA